MSWYSPDTMSRFSKCDPENQQRYDAKIIEIIAGVMTGSADPVIQDNFEKLLQQANTIVFN